MDTKRRGQALIELAFGMFALALVLSTLFAFATYIVQSLNAQRTVRSSAGESALTSSTTGATRTETEEATFDAIAAEYIFGSSTIKIKETVYLPPLTLVPTE